MNTLSTADPRPLYSPEPRVVTWLETDDRRAQLVLDLAREHGPEASTQRIRDDYERMRVDLDRHVDTVAWWPVYHAARASMGLPFVRAVLRQAQAACTRATGRTHDHVATSRAETARPE